MAFEDIHVLLFFFLFRFEIYSVEKAFIFGRYDTSYMLVSLLNKLKKLYPTPITYPSKDFNDVFP